VGLVVFGVPHDGLFFGFCFVFGLFCVVCWGVAAAFFCTWCMGLVDFACGGMQKPPKNPQAKKLKMNLFDLLLNRGSCESNKATQVPICLNSFVVGFRQTI
jgi:hypothetical protein